MPPILYVSVLLTNVHTNLTTQSPERVTAHTLPDNRHTVIVIKFPNDENLPFSLSQRREYHKGTISKRIYKQKAFYRFRETFRFEGGLVLGAGMVIFQKTFEQFPILTHAVNAYRKRADEAKQHRNEVARLLSSLLDSNVCSRGISVWQKELELIIYRVVPSLEQRVGHENNLLFLFGSVSLF